MSRRRRLRCKAVLWKKKIHWFYFYHSGLVISPSPPPPSPDLRLAEQITQVKCSLRCKYIKYTFSALFPRKPGRFVYNIFDETFVLSVKSCYVALSCAGLRLVTCLCTIPARVLATLKGLWLKPSSLRFNLFFLQRSCLNICIIFFWG